MQNYAELYIHELDREALDKIKALPGYEEVMKLLVKDNFDIQTRSLLMSSAIRLGKDQSPEIYGLLPPICEKLGIEVPEVFVKDGEEEIYTTGDEKPMIVLPAKTVEEMSEEELKISLAHECGHIACGHVLYNTAASYLNRTKDKSVFSQKAKELFTSGMHYAFTYWGKMADFSADRAAAIVAGSGEPIIDYLIDSTGLAKFVTNKDAYLKQGEECLLKIDESLLGKALSLVMAVDDEQPANSARALEVRKWCETDIFKAILEGRTEQLLQEKAEAEKNAEEEEKESGFFSSLFN